MTVLRQDGFSSKERKSGIKMKPGWRGGNQGSLSRIDKESRSDLKVQFLASMQSRLDTDSK